MRHGTPTEPTPLPEAFVDANGNPLICACPICGAINIGMPPHGVGLPCPIALAKAEREKQDQDRVAFAFNDLNAMLKKLGVFPSQEED